MSENPGLPGFGAEDEAPAQGKRRLVFIAVIVAVVAALGGGGYMLISGGDDAAASVAAPLPTPRVATGSSRASTTASSAPTRTLPPVASEPVRHDPFKPLYSPIPEATTADPSAGGPVVGTDTSIPTPGSTVSGIPGTGTGTGIGGTGTGTVGGQNVVTFTSIDTKAKIPTVSVRLDGLVVVGAAGDTLGGVLKVVSIRPDDGAATFQLGEATFDLHLGQSYIN